MPGARSCLLGPPRSREGQGQARPGSRASSAQLFSALFLEEEAGKQPRGHGEMQLWPPPGKGAASVHAMSWEGLSPDPQGTVPICWGCEGSACSCGWGGEAEGGLGSSNAAAPCVDVPPPPAGGGSGLEAPAASPNKGKGSWSHVPHPARSCSPRQHRALSLALVKDRGPRDSAARRWAGTPGDGVVTPTRQH